jgi:hypothetical protein
LGNDGIEAFTSKIQDSDVQPIDLAISIALYANKFGDAKKIRKSIVNIILGCNRFMQTLPI